MPFFEILRPYCRRTSGRRPCNRWKRSFCQEAVIIGVNRLKRKHQDSVSSKHVHAFRASGNGADVQVQAGAMGFGFESITVLEAIHVKLPACRSCSEGLTSLAVCGLSRMASCRCRVTRCYAGSSLSCGLWPRAIRLKQQASADPVGARALARIFGSGLF